LVSRRTIQPLSIWKIENKLKIYLLKPKNDFNKQIKRKSHWFHAERYSCSQFGKSRISWKFTYGNQKMVSISKSNAKSWRKLNFTHRNRKTVSVSKCKRESEKFRSRSRKVTSIIRITLKTVLFYVRTGCEIRYFFKINYLYLMAIPEPSHRLSNPKNYCLKPLTFPSLFRRSVTLVRRFDHLNYRRIMIFIKTLFILVFGNRARDFFTQSGQN
jgi:hypothetical protein